VYITEVRTLDTKCTEFKLLRCSTNLAGPTETVAPVDARIMSEVNALADLNFVRHAPMDHVLAQMYENKVDGVKHRKARIKPHSDKTKDMPANGLMAFVTAYKFPAASRAFTRSGFDLLHKDVSALTKLVWKAKAPEYVYPDVSVTLYPGSVLLVPLDTNRCFTHEIRPSALAVDMIPTRLGYVVRCSKTTAVHDTETHKTYIRSAYDETKLVEMRPPTLADFAEIRALYMLENTTSQEVSYLSTTHGHDIPYSMNTGDYLPPRSKEPW
jgi:hypothetical protein